MRGMTFTASKFVSLVIAITYAIGITVVQGGVTSAVVVTWLILIFPLALIWFPDELGSFTGYVGRGGNINSETPGALIAMMGWFFLVGFPALMYFLRR
jgi:hypothetical protein